MKIFDNNTFTIGNTPLVKLNRLSAGLPCDILVKIEGRNPAYSVKCRIGTAMVKDAIDRGVLKPGMTVIEPTSGNTGIGLAYAGATLGYKVTLVMPDTMSVERRQMMSAFGADFVLTPGAEGMSGAIKMAEKMALDAPDTYFMPQQFKNPANPAIHEKTTGPEIWNDTDGRVDVLVAGIGTGGTITGSTRFLKTKKDIISIGVEPSNSPVITQTLSGEELKPSPHRIQGIGAGFVPDTLDLGVVDNIVKIDDEEAIEYMQRLAKEEGIIAGISSGAAVAGAVKAIKELGLMDKLIVVVLPDSGERYLSMDVF
jgi:cysteine synthase A